MAAHRIRHPQVKESNPLLVSALITVPSRGLSEARSEKAAVRFDDPRGQLERGGEAFGEY